MAGGLRTGYWLLLALVASIWLSAVLLTEYPLTTYLSTLGRGRFIILWFLPPVVWLGWIAVLLMLRRSARPASALRRIALRDRYWLARGVGFGLLLIPLSIAFTAFKRSIPKVVPFYLDPFLADLDRWLFLGSDPWRITHGLFSLEVSLFLDRFYLVWFPASAILLGCFLFTRDQRFQLRGLLTYVLTWFVLGSLLATSLASVGPVYYEAFYPGNPFAELNAKLAADASAHGLIAPRIQAGLLRSFGGTFVGSGISAMPSLHVGIAFLLFVASARLLKPFAVIYVILIWIGSVHLGWHYATDGLLSIVVVALLWWAMGRFVTWLEVCEALHDARAASSIRSLKPT